MAKNNLVYIIGIIIVIAAVIGIASLTGGKGHPNTANLTTSSIATTTIQNASIPSTSTIQSQSNTSSPTPKHLILMTDPAQVPTGTSAMVIEYTSMKVYETNSTGTSWIDVPASSFVNLLSIQSTSQVMGSFNATPNSTIHAISFDVISASATVNGTTYMMAVPNSTVSVNITGNAALSANSSILLDFFPTVATAPGANSTLTYVIGPSATAILVANSTSTASSSQSIGATVPLTPNVKAQLHLAAPSITISSANITQTGNITSISVVVRDNSNRSVEINGIAIYGNESTYSTQGGVSISIAAGMLSASAQAAAQIDSFKTMSFIIAPNGSLGLATMPNSWQSNGYTVNSGASATFTFSGPVNYGGGTVNARLSSGKQYNVAAFGDGGASQSVLTNAG